MYSCKQSYLTSHLRCPERLTSGYCTPSDSECSGSESDYEEYEGDSPYRKAPSQKCKADTAAAPAAPAAANMREEAILKLDTKELDTKELDAETTYVNTGQGEQVDRIWREHLSLVLSLPTTPDIKVETIALQLAQQTFHRSVQHRVRYVGMNVPKVEKNCFFLKEMALAVLLSVTEECAQRRYDGVLMTTYLFYHLSIVSSPLLDHSWSQCFRLISCYRDLFEVAHSSMLKSFDIEEADKFWRSWCEREPEPLLQELVREKRDVRLLLTGHRGTFPELDIYIVPSLRLVVEECERQWKEQETMKAVKNKEARAEQMDRFATKRLKAVAAKNAAAEARFKAYEKQKVEAKREKAAKLLHYEKCRKKKSKEEEEERVCQLAEFHTLRLQRYFEGAKKEQERRRLNLMSLSQPRILSPTKKREKKIRRRQEQEEQHAIWKAKKKNARG